ncbi:hypothetical protein H105_02555 [Trichophyton soudanense CBS 452.61]|uniref:Uncharacterized protein n=1 Tax=Trichophyton soudanense CBS 452.61 TaxID=1215331 RepID=A0A022XZ62_TRISD|nr:hypothetical protein H105_02555 [Trichophyton soudanense CBS 452.61]
MYTSGISECGRGRWKSKHSQLTGPHCSPRTGHRPNHIPQKGNKGFRPLSTASHILHTSISNLYMANQRSPQRSSSQHSRREQVPSDYAVTVCVYARVWCG